MGQLQGLRNRLVDAPGSVGERRRAGRWERLRETFPEIESMSVMDLGGTAEAWQRAPLRPASVHVVNLEPEPEGLPDWIRADQADATALPPTIIGAHYDLVFSNSVIEHVGGHVQRLRFADAIHKLADRHWVQTPYRYFPIEPHWLFPRFSVPPAHCPGGDFTPLAAGAYSVAKSGRGTARRNECRVAEPDRDGRLFPRLGNLHRADAGYHEVPHRHQEIG